MVIWVIHQEKMEIMLVRIWLCLKRVEAFAVAYLTIIIFSSEKYQNKVYDPLRVRNWTIAWSKYGEAYGC